MAVEFGLLRTSTRALSVAIRAASGEPQSQVSLGRQVNSARQLIVGVTAAKVRGGIGLTSDDCVCITETEPSVKKFASGIVTDVNGVVWATENPTLPLKGIFDPTFEFVFIDQRGALYVDFGSSFTIQLSDSGAGAVSTGVLLGTGPATFTRATVAWTKLSTGLWAQVASGVARSSYIGNNTAVGAYGGYFAESAGIQLVTPTASIRDMTNAAWVKGATMTAAKDAVGIDGVVNSASTLTGGAVGATNTALQTLVAAASSRTYSCFMRRKTGTGVINLLQGATTLDVTALINSSTYTRVELAASVLNSAFGIQVVTNTDAIEVDFNQFETGANATSPMDAAGAVRALDALSYPSGNANLSAGTAYAEVSTPWTVSSGGWVVGTDGNGRIMYNQGSGTSTSFRTFDGTNDVASGSVFDSTATGVRKRAVSWGGIIIQQAGNGVLATAGVFDTTMGAVTSLDIGYNAAVGGYNGFIKNVRIWSTQLTNAQLQTLTS